MYAFFIFLFSFTHELMTDTHSATMTNKLCFYILFVYNKGKHDNTISGDLTLWAQFTNSEF